MKNKRFLLFVFAALLLSVSLILASCNGSGETTTEAPEITDDPVTKAPEATSDEATTEATPVDTTEEITEEVTTEAPAETTNAPEVTTEAPVETTKAPVETTVAPEVTTDGNHTHSFGAWTVLKAATCTEGGSEERTCSCGEKETRDIAALGHTDSKWITDKEATCTEEGSKNQVCSNCGVTLATEKLAAKGHTEVTDAAVAATCIKNGLTEGKHCSVCNTVFKAQETVKALGHKDGEWIVDKEATTSATGSKRLVCATCGSTIKTETIPVIEQAKNEYTVVITDGFGNPASGINVSFMNGNAEAAKVKTDAQGRAVAKLELNEYEVVLEDTGAYYITSESYKVSSSAPTVEISLIKYADSPQMVYPDTVNGVYDVSVGSIRVPVEKDKIRYFFFSPSEGAIYHIYTDSDKVEVGYYGTNFFVTSNNTGNIDENGVLIQQVRLSEVGNKLVIGLTSKSATVDECTLTIVKAGEVELTLQELPWEQYKLDHTPEKCETPRGTLAYVPITVRLSSMGGAINEIKVVYSEKDGYYHLEKEDGPVLYVRVSMSTPYLDPFKTIAGVTNIGKYIYDEKGEFVRKESYNDAILAYGAAADSKHGVVPLDEHLIYILKSAGEDGWYVKSSPDYIFDNGTVPINVMPFNAWLFAVVYFE